MFHIISLIVIYCTLKKENHMKKKIVVFFVFCIMILNLVGCEKTFKNYDFKEVNLFDENIVDI